MARGKPFEPGNKFGRGRPPGSRNKTSSIARAYLDEFEEALIKKAIQLALQKDDTTALKLCIERILPPLKERPVKIGKLRTRTAEEVSKATEVVTQKVTSGRITPGEGQAVADLLEGRRRAIETVDLAGKVEIVEESLARSNSTSKKSKFG